MYSELLGGLCTEADPIHLPNSRDELVVILLQCRRRLHEHSSGDGHEMTEDLALELDHDRMLLRLCAAMGIDRALDHADLCDATSPLFIAENPALDDTLSTIGPVKTTPRIGITKAAELPLRFFLAGSRFVSQR